MKKSFTLLLCLAMLISISGCNISQLTSEKKDLVDTTSDFSVPETSSISLTTSTIPSEEPIQQMSEQPMQEQTTVPITTSFEDESVSVGEANALRSAKNYLSFMAFSYNGLIDQLEYEGYTLSEATYAVDNCGADWNSQAVKSAKSYLSFSAFSYSGLIGQLEYEGFTTEEATYAADNCGADWYEQAAKSAKSYLDFMAFSRDGLIDQLEYEGFTYEQAVYGAEANGL